METEWRPAVLNVIMDMFMESKWERFRREFNIDLPAEIAAGSPDGGLDNYFTKDEVETLLEPKVESTHLTELESRLEALETTSTTPQQPTDPDTIDHGSLTGLSDDDHPQYHNDTRADVRYYTKGQVDSSLSGKSSSGHNHDATYYTEPEVDSLLSSKANSSAVTAIDAELDDKASTAHVHLNLGAYESVPTPGELTGPVGQRLTIPTHVSPAGGQTTHPSIVFVPEGWNGFKYWMAHTPYPGGNDDHEDPNICASHDGITWVVPSGLTNPIDDQDGQPEYNSDVDLRLVDNKLYLFWRTFNDALVGSEERLYYSTSTNGTTWAAKIELYRSNMASQRLLSPSFVWEGDKWTMFAVDATPSPNRVVKLTSVSANPAGGWSAATIVAMGAMQSGKEPWHMQVTKYAGRYIGLLADCTIDASGSNGDLLFIQSADGLTFANSGGPVVPRSYPGEHDQVYRATLLPSIEKGVFGFRVWYAGWTTAGPVWNVYRTWIGPTIGQKSAATGSFSTANIIAAGSITTAVTFPVGLFSSAPHVNAMTNSSRLSLAVTSITKDGCSVIASNWSPATASGVTINWDAHEK